MLIANSKDFSQAVRIASRFTNARSPSDRHKVLKLISDGNKLSVVGHCPFGSCSTSVGANNAIEATVSADTLVRTVGLAEQEFIGLDLTGSYLRVQDGKSCVDLPVHDSFVKPEVTAATGVLTADPSDVVRCLEATNAIRLNTELKFADGVRIYTDGGRLCFASGISQAMGWAWCDYSGDEMDAVLLRQAVAPTIQALRTNDSLIITAREKHIQFQGEDSLVVAQVATEGVRAFRYSDMESKLKSGHKWVLNKDELLSFCKRASVFSTGEASGVWLRPSEEGLLCEYDGISDGTYAADLSVDAHCQSLIEGSFAGEDVYLSNRLLYPAVGSICDDSISVFTNERALVIIGESGAAGLGLMTKPGGKR